MSNPARPDSEAVATAELASDKSPSTAELEEYKYLTSEISEIYKNLSNLERYVVIGTSAIYVWLLEKNTTSWSSLELAWWLPVGLCAVTWGRSIQYTRGVYRISKHIAEQHQRIGYDGSWEIRQQHRRFDRKFVGYTWAWIGGSSGLFFITLAAITVVIGLLHPHLSAPVALAASCR